MDEWLEKLRQKPEPVRRAIAFWSSAIIVFVIVSVWLVGLPGRFRVQDNSTATDEQANQMVAGAMSPFDNLKEEWNNLMANVEGNFQYEK